MTMKPQSYLKSNGTPNSEAEVEAESALPVERIVDDVSINDPVRQYLREIGRHPLLTAEQEVAIAKRIRAGQETEAMLREMAGDSMSPTEILASFSEEEQVRLQAIIDDGYQAQRNSGAVTCAWW